MSRPTLQHLQIGGLISQAGGDPWAVDDSLQAGSPTQINFLAQAFHSAAGSATSAEDAFVTARQHFEQYNRENGEQPINNSAEVQRVKDGLHATHQQLGQIAADLESIAAALAQARAASLANITALNANLIVLDARIGVYLEQERQGHDHGADIAQCRALAEADTETALHNATVIRNGYSKTLQQALTNLRVRDGYDPDAALGEFDADAPAPPPGPVPDDPTQFNDYWNSLTPGQKDWLYNADHNIGNHPGMPCDPPDHLGYDHYNKLHLADELNRAQGAAAQAEALKNQHPDWAAGNDIPRPNEPGAIFDDRVAYENWQRQYDAARDGAKYLPDLQAVDAAVRASPDRKLMLLDTQSGTQARAATAVGDPDKATHVSVTTPGLNTTVHGGIGGMTEEATNLRQEALRQLALTPGHATDSVSTIAWIGYDPPQVPGFDDKTASLSGIWGVTHDDLARAGAHDLARFYDGIQASHLGGPADLTAIGHSYGSLTTGLALQEPGDHGVSRRCSTDPPESQPPHRSSCSCTPARSTRWKPPMIRFSGSTTPGRWDRASRSWALTSTTSWAISDRTRPPTPNSPDWPPVPRVCPTGMAAPSCCRKRTATAITRVSPTAEACGRPTTTSPRSWRVSATRRFEEIDVSPHVPTPAATMPVRCLGHRRTNRRMSRVPAL